MRNNIDEMTQEEVDREIKILEHSPFLKLEVLRKGDAQRQKLACLRHLEACGRKYAKNIGILSPEVSDELIDDAIKAMWEDSLIASCDCQ